MEYEEEQCLICAYPIKKPKGSDTCVQCPRCGWRSCNE